MDKDLHRVLRNLDKIPVVIQGRVADSALRAGAVVLQKQAIENLPEDTGNLKEGVKIKKRRKKGKKDPTTTFAIGMDNSEYEFENGKKSIKPKTTKSFYASMLHFGTKYTAPVPFMTMAFESSGKKALSAMKNYMAKRVERELKKLK